MTTRDRTVVMVLGLLAIVAAFWFLLLSPKKDDVASLSEQVTTAQTRLEAADSTVQSAAAAKKRYAADYRAVANLGKAVPADDDVPSLVFQLQGASVASKIEFDSIKLTGAGGAATPAPVAAPTAAQAAEVGKEADKGAAAATPPPAPAPASAAVPAAQTAFAGLPPGASVGPAGLPTMPFDFEFSGPFLRLEKLLRKIDAFTQTSGGRIRVNGRLMTIDSIALAGFPDMKATVRATAFLVPDAEGLLAGAGAAGPATASVSTTTAVPSTGAPVTPVAAATPAVGVTK